MFHTLPESCQAYLNRTLQPAVPFTLGDAHDRPHIWQSKVGGNPYLPLGADYPRNAKGEPLTLLAQVNFAEMLPLPDFPSSGLLQFFIDGTDYSCGMDFEYQSMENYRVVYHPEVTHDLTQLCHDFAPFQAASLDKDALPMNGEYRIIFQDAVQQPITCGDFRNELTNDWEKRDAKIWDILFDQYSGEGHRIGGYPFFTQEDPRGYLPHLQQHIILLLQLDSDAGDDGIDKVLWGDVGVGNFFITPEDLQRRDFSHVLFTWDCC